MSDMGLLTQEKMAQSSALMYDLPYLEPTKIDMVNGKFLRSKGVDLNVYDGHVPLGFKNGKLIVGISDFNKKNEALTYWHKFSPVLWIGANATLQRVFKQNFAKTEQEFNAIFYEFVRASITKTDIEDSTLMAKLFSTLIRHACYQEVSDIHLFKTSEDVGVIKFRKDGVVRQFRTMPSSVYDRMLQKVMTDANIQTEKLFDRPQEAIVAFDDDSKRQLGDIMIRYNFRLQMFNTPRRGKTAVIRILDRESAKRELTHLGYEGETLKN